METKTAPQTPPQQAALWARVVDDPNLQDLPYKVETNEHGQIVLSPHKNVHSILQTAITDLLRDLIDASGVRAVEFAVETAKGTKAPDVIWISEARYAQAPRDAASSPVMPEICVEVLSSSNTAVEIEEKCRLYLDGGAEEVWIVTGAGQVTFYDADGRRTASQRVPAFPAQVNV